MLAGPLFVREMVAIARRRRGYHRRASMAALALLIIAGNYVALWLTYEGPLTIAQTARFGRSTFAILTAVQVFLAIFVVADIVARTVTREREAGSLEALLASPLSSTEIVVGKLMASLLEFASVMAAGLPIMALMPLFGGSDPRLVLLAYAGIAATAFAVGSFSILVSTRSRTSREALTKAVGLTCLWIVVPFPLALVMPRFWPLVYHWLGWLNTWLIISSPFGLFANLIGMLSRGSLLEQFATMVGLELVFGSVCLLAAIYSLRPAARRLAEGAATSRIRSLKNWRWRLWPRPACGDDPVLWKELYTCQASGLSQLVGLIIWLSVFALAVGVFEFLSRSSFQEIHDFGYWSRGRDDSRTDFNLLLRCGTMLFFLVHTLILTGMAAERIGLERVRQTWTSLLTTPLTGAEILRGYRRGITIRLGAFALAGVAFWTFGLAAGAIHPVGFVAVILYLIVTTCFCAALGSSLSLWSRDAAAAGSLPMGILMFLLALSAVSFVPSPLASVVWSVGSPPFLASEVLISFRDARKAFSPSGHITVSPFPSLSTAPVWLLVGTYLVSLVGFAVATPLLIRHANRRFDALVGRPQRSTETSHSASNTRHDLSSAGRAPKVGENCLNSSLLA